MEVTKMQTLVEAAFRSAVTPAEHAALMVKVAAMLAAPRSPPQTFADLFVPSSSKTESGGWTIAEANEMPDRRGVSLTWQNASRLVALQQDILWADLPHLEPPPQADPYQGHLMRHRAKALWDLITSRFDERIHSGEVSLYGRRGSVFAEPAAIPSAAAPQTNVLDWPSGVVDVAGEQVFDVHVIPTPDPDAAYVDAVRAFANKRREVAKKIAGRLYPTGVPSKDDVPDHVVLDAISDEIRRLKRVFGVAIAPPSDSTLLRSIGRKK